jgi:RNA polymerase sigma factor (sigma-70 family)
MESLFGSGSAVGLSDRELLDRVTAAHEPNADAEAAFATIVARHGPMVFKVCRQLLRDNHHADDAFQAVFLVLARKARSIQDPDKLSNWLHGVAIRTARCSKTQIKRRRQCEQGPIMNPTTTLEPETSEPLSPAISPEQALLNVEQAELLHTEIARLPQSFRLPILLCYFSGLSLDQAATQLKWPQGTLRSRLARAREKLRRSLSRRGFTLSTTALIAILSTKTTSAQLPRLLCHQTARAALQYTAGHAAGGVLSASATGIATEVLKTMTWSTVKVTLAGVLTLGMIGTGYLGVITYGASTPRANTPEARPKTPDSARPHNVSPPALVLHSPAKPTGKSEARMTVTARVVDPAGKPVKGAAVDLVGAHTQITLGTSVEYNRIRRLGQTTTDSDGRIRIQVTQPVSTGYYSNALAALAAAPGYGVGWAHLNADASQADAEIRLLPERRVRIRLVDIAGLPASGVELMLNRMGRSGPDRDGDSISLPSETTNPKASPYFVKTDDNGWATWPGIGQGIEFSIVIHDPRYAEQILEISGDNPANGKDQTLVLKPGKLIEGRVLAADTRQPIPNAVINVIASDGQFGLLFSTKSRADAQGHFAVNPYPGDYFRVRVHAPDGLPYPVPELEFAWNKGAVKKAIDIEVPKGCLLQGKVTEQGTERPLAGCTIQYVPTKRSGKTLNGWQAAVASHGDGSFQIAVPGSTGHLLIFGPTADYLLEEIGSNQLISKGMSGERKYAHAIIPYEIKANETSPEIMARLRPGATVHGRVQGPQGQKIGDAVLITSLDVPTTVFASYARMKFHDGHFTLRGVDPQGSTRIHILDPEHEWGTSLEVSGKQADKEVTAKLEPCGQARMRFVGPDGKPVANVMVWPYLKLVVTPGPTQYSRAPQDREKLFAHEAYLVNMDKKHYGHDVKTDANGSYTMPALVPGALYRVIDYSTINDLKKGTQVRKDFTVKSAETVNLGDILIENPNND